MTKKKFESTGWQKGKEVTWDGNIVTVLGIDFEDNKIFIRQGTIGFWVSYRFIKLKNSI